MSVEIPKPKTRFPGGAADDVPRSVRWAIDREVIFAVAVVVSVDDLVTGNSPVDKEPRRITCFRAEYPPESVCVRREISSSITVKIAGQRNPPTTDVEVRAEPSVLRRTQNCPVDGRKIV